MNQRLVRDAKTRTRRNRYFRLALLETLEDRRVLASMPFEEAATLFASGPVITGATIITHGFQPSNNQLLSQLGSGDSLSPLANSIRNRADTANGPAETAWILDYDIAGEGSTGYFDTTQSILPNASSVGQKGELVLLFDWAPESNELSAGWGEAAGDALFSMLVGLGVVDPTLGPANSIPLHFIGHSFGTAVTSEAIERLARFDIPVDQVTYLDPHDFDQSLQLDSQLGVQAPVPVDDQQELFTLGQPQLEPPTSREYGLNYGAAVWDNVAFADVYYQTESEPIPEGRPIPGAFNRFVSDVVGVDGINAHSHVWNRYYFASITGSLTEDINSNGVLDTGEDVDGDDALTVLSGFDPKKTGFAYSRIARKQAASVDPASVIDRPSPTFFDAGQNHEHTPSSIVLRDEFGNSLRFPDGSYRANESSLKSVDPALALKLIGASTLTTADIEFGRWNPQWAKSDIANGNYNFGGDRNDPISLSVFGNDLAPGWSHHGGGGLGRFVPLFKIKDPIAIPTPSTSVSTVRLDDASLPYLDRLPTMYPFSIRIGAERMTVTSRSGNTLAVIRNVESFSSTAHNVGTIVVPDRGGFELELKSGNASRTHNRFYLWPEYDELKITFSVPGSSAKPSPDQLEIKISTADGVAKIEQYVRVNLGPTKTARDSTGAEVLVSSNGSTYTVRVPIPLGNRNRLNTLSLQLRSQAGAIGAETRVRMQSAVLESRGTVRSVRSGDVVPIDLKQLHPQAISFDKSLRFAVAKNGNLSDLVNLQVTADEKRGDLTLRSGVATQSSGILGTVLLSHRLDSTLLDINQTLSPFEATGRLYFAPGAADELFGDMDTQEPGFQGFLVMYYTVDGQAERSLIIQVAPGYTDFDGGVANTGTTGVNEGDEAVTNAVPIQSSRDTVNVMRIQQRLNYLGFLDYDGLPLVIDGILGPRTQSVISLFRAAIDPSGGRIPYTPGDGTDENTSTSLANYELDELTLAWLNSRSAPRWLQLSRSVATLATAIDQNASSNIMQFTQPVSLTAGSYLRIGNEILKVTSVLNTISVTVFRGSADTGGVQDTTRAAHQVGDSVYLVPEHGWGTSWLFNALQASGLISGLNEDTGVVTDLSRILRISPMRGDGDGFLTGHADTNPTDSDAEMHRNGLQVDIDITGMTAFNGLTTAQKIQAIRTAIVGGQTNIRDAYVGHISGNQFHVTVMPPRLLAFTGRQQELLQLGIKSLQSRLTALESAGDLATPLPLIGPAGILTSESDDEIVRVGETLQLRRTVDEAFNLLLHHLSSQGSPTVDSLLNSIDPAKLSALLANTGIHVTHAALSATSDDAFDRSFKLAIKTETTITRDLDLGDEATSQGILIQPDPERLRSSTRLSDVVPGWNAANGSHKGRDIVITMRDGTTKINVAFDGINEGHSLMDVVARINAAASSAGVGGVLKAQLDVNRILISDSTSGPEPLTVERAPASPQVEADGNTLVELSSRVGELLRIVGQDADGDGVVEGGRLFAATLLRHLTPDWDRLHREIYSPGNLVVPAYDLKVVLRDGNSFTVSWKQFDSMNTLADLLRSIRDAAAVNPSTAGKIEAAVVDGRIILTDLSAGTGPFTVSSSLASQMPAGAKPLAELIKLTGSTATVSANGSQWLSGLLNQRVDLKASLDMELSIRMNLAPSAALSERFSSKIDKLKASVDLSPHGATSLKPHEFPGQFSLSAGLFDLRAGYDTNHRAQLDLQVDFSSTVVDSEWSLAELRSMALSDLVSVKISGMNSAVEQSALTTGLDVFVVPTQLYLGECSALEASVEGNRIVLRDLNPESSGEGFRVTQANGSPVATLLKLNNLDDDDDTLSGHFDGVIRTALFAGNISENTTLGTIAGDPSWTAPNDGLPDLEITLQSGDKRYVNLDGLTATNTLGQVLARINDVACMSNDAPFEPIYFHVGQLGSAASANEQDFPLHVRFPYPILLTGTPGGHLAMLGLVESSLTSLLSTAFFQTPIPLSKGQTLAGLTALDAAFQQYMVEPFQEMVDALRFQGFNDLQYGNGSVRITCIEVDPSTGQVTADVLVDFVSSPKPVALGLTGGLGPLTSVTSSGSASAITTSTMQFTLGFDLNALGQPLGSSALALSASTPLSELNKIGLPVGSGGVIGVTEFLTPTGNQAKLHQGEDIKVTLANGTTFNVKFDGLTTLGQVVGALNTAAALVGAGTWFHAVIGGDPLKEGIVLTDSSFGPEGSFKIEAINGSMSGLSGIGLGILGIVADPDEDGLRVLRGAALHGDTLANHVYFVSNANNKPQFHSSIDLTVENINATGNLGPVPVTITNGTGSAQFSTSLQLVDPNIIPGTIGRITMSELTRSVINGAQGSGGDDLIDVQNLNGVAAMTLPATATLLSGTGGAPITDSGTILVNWNPIFGQAGSASSSLQPITDNIKVTVAGFQKVKQLEKLSPDDIANAFALAGQYFEQLLNNPTGLLKQNIPGLEQNVAELLDIDKLLSTASTVLKGQALQQLSLLEEQLESAVEDAVKLPKTRGIDGPTVEIALDESGGTALKISIKLPRDLTANSDLDADKIKSGLQVPFGLSLLNGSIGSASSINDTGGKALIDVQANADFVIALGIDLTNPSQPKPFLYGGNGVNDTHTTVSLKANANGLNFNASIGALGLFVENGSLVLDADGDGASTAPAVFEAKLAQGRHYLSSPASIAAATGVNLTAGVTGTLPVYFPTKSPSHRLSPDLKVDVNSLGDFFQSPGFTVNPQTPVQAAANARLYVPDLQSAIDNLNFTDGMSGFAAGWDGVFKILETVVDNKVFVQKIPLVGNQLVDASQFLLNVRNQVSADLNSAASSGLTETQRVLFNALGPGGLNWLRDISGDGLVTQVDVRVWANQASTGIGTDITDALLAGQPPVNTGTRSILFDMRLEQPIADVGVPLKLDLALPGLGLDVDGNVRLRAGAKLDLRIGVDRDQGVFLDTSRNDEFQVSIDATIPGLRADASLGFLGLEVSDSVSSPSHIGGAYFVNLVDPNKDGRLTLNELTRSANNPGQLIDSRFEAVGTQQINLDFTTSINDDAKFPQFHGQFQIQFANGVRDGSGLFDYQPNVTIADVRMNPGQAIKAFAGPILERVAAVLEPIKPVTDFITAPLPLISDLAGTPITMLDVAEVFGYVTPETRQYIEAAKIIVDLAANYSKVGDGSILIGSLNLADLNLRTQSVSTLDINAVRGDLLKLEDLDVQLEGSSAGGFLDRAGDTPSAGEETEDNPGGIRFPLFEDPKLAFKLLLGQDVDLFVYDMPRLDTQFSYSQQFPIIPPFLWGVVEGKLQASADFAFGFDTRGLRQFQTSRKATDIFNGFFVFDAIDGVDVPEAILEGSLTVTAGPPQIPKINTGIGSIEARVGITGGLFATANFNLNDPNQDGKVHFDELKAAFQAAIDHSDPLYVFDVDGNIRVELFAFAKIEGSIKIGGKKKTKTIIDKHVDIIPPIILKEFSAHREIPPLVELEPPPEPDILGLISQFEGKRAITLDVSESTLGDDLIAITRAASNNYVISINGRTSEIPGSANAEVIVIDAGLGNDTVTVHDSITIPAYLFGGAGDDTLKGGSGNDVL